MLSSTQKNVFQRSIFPFKNQIIFSIFYFKSSLKILNMNMVKKNLSDRQIFQKTTQKRIPSIFCQLGNVRFLKGKSNFDSFNLDFLQMQTRGRRRHSLEMNRFMRDEMTYQNAKKKLAFFISRYFKSKNRSISLSHMMKHKLF